ncbi:unnamed protein product, partial [Coccothraustes coccothraustes]
ALQSMDIMLVVMVLNSAGSESCEMLQDILEILLDYLFSDMEAVQERAMGRIKLLCGLLTDCVTDQDDEDEDDDAPGEQIQMPLLGKLLAHLFFKLFRPPETVSLVVQILGSLLTFFSGQKCKRSCESRAQPPECWESEITSWVNAPRAWKVQKEDCVRERSISLFGALLGKTTWRNKEAMRRNSWKALVRLVLHMSDQAPGVAKASKEAVVAVAEFLKWKELKELVQKEQIWKMGECLLAKDSSRAEQFVLDSQPYLLSPQASLREAALRFYGLAARHLTEQNKETKTAVLSELGAMETQEENPSICSLAAQTSLILSSLRDQRKSGFSLRTLCCCCH